jgi:hypothetical protein
MAPKASLTAAGRSAAAAAAASASAGAGALAAAAPGEEVPYGLLSARDKVASVMAKLRGEGEWTQEELYDFMYWCVWAGCFVSSRCASPGVWRSPARGRSLSLVSLLEKQQPPNKPTTPNKPNRFRQAFGLAVGVLWGYLPWTGFVAFLAFVAANVVAASALQAQLALDDDHPAVQGGELVGEGMPGSLSLFLVAWTLSYTAFHGGAGGGAGGAAAPA